MPLSHRFTWSTRRIGTGALALPGPLHEVRAHARHSGATICKDLRIAMSTNWPPRLRQSENIRRTCGSQSGGALNPQR
jgi:hypothetical protein